MTVDFSRAVDQLEQMVNDLVAAVPAVIIAIMVFVTFMLIAKLVQRIIVTLSDRAQRRRNVWLVISRLTQWTLIIVGFLVGAVIIFPNFTPSELLQLLGLSSVAIGFAFRDILQHLLVGLILLLNEPFRVGDQILLEGVHGTVEEIGSRATVIRTYDGQRIFVPNTTIYNNNVLVNTTHDKRRIDVDLRLTYDTDVEQAKQVIQHTLETLDNPKILTGPPPDVLLMDFAEYYITLRVRWWIHPPLYQAELSTRNDVLSALKQSLDSAGITLALPTQHLLIHDETGARAHPYVVNQQRD